MCEFMIFMLRIRLGYFKYLRVSLNVLNSVFFVSFCYDLKIP